MALLFEAASAWNNLLNVSYQITYGKKGKLYHISLSFEPDQFLHLSGIHYIDDVDFQRPYNKRNFVSLLLSKEIDAAKIEQSANWVDIKGRLEALVRLEKILDTDFSLYLFRGDNLPFYSDVKANFLIRNLQTGDVVFLFVDGPLDKSFCRSVFSMTDRDYSMGQKKVGLLKKVKYNNGAAETLYEKYPSEN